jgi:hypothetical protein
MAKGVALKLLRNFLRKRFAKEVFSLPENVEGRGTNVMLLAFV